MHLLFDTETTGLADFTQPPEAPCQPRLVQLAALLLDDKFNSVAQFCLIIKPEGHVIDNNSKAVAVTGITHERAMQFGVAEKASLLLFAALCKRADTLIAHNLQFDAIVIGRACHIHQLDFAPPANKYCTMQAMTPVCNLPGKYPGKPKWPTLTEAYHHITGKDPELAHDAMADVMSCATIYKWLLAQKAARQVAFQKAIN